MSEKIDVEIGFKIEKYTVVKCSNVMCRFNRRYLGDLYCNFKQIKINEKGECSHKEERCQQA